MRTWSIFPLTISLFLGACTEFVDTQSPKVDLAETHAPPVSKAECVDDMAKGPEDCSKSEEAWNDQRKRKAKALPFPVIDKPPPEKNASTHQDGASGEPPSGRSSSSSSIAKTICDDDTSDVKQGEGCAVPARDYWTDERRSKAKALEPTAPELKTKRVETAKPLPAGAASPGAAGRGPKQLLPIPEDQD